MKWIRCPYKIRKYKDSFIAEQNYFKLFEFCRFNKIDTEILAKYYNDLFEVDFIAITHIGIENNKIIYVITIDSGIQFKTFNDIEIEIDKIDYDSTEGIKEWTYFTPNPSAKLISNANEIRKIVKNGLTEFLKNITTKN